MKYANIDGRTKNAIKTRVLSTINKYGLDISRVVILRTFKDIRKESKLIETITEKEDELTLLREKL